MKRHALRKNLPVATLKRHATFWRHLSSVYELAALLRTPRHRLQLLAAGPRYKTYCIPKKDGDYRRIEDPAPALKRVLRMINHYLQAHY